MDGSGCVSLPILEELTHFLSQYAWLFNFSNISALELDVFHSFPLEWRLFLQTNLSVAKLKEILSGQAMEEAPDFLVQFVRLRNACLNKLLQIVHPSLDTTQKPCIVDALRRGMTPKKVHEVEEFSKCIHDNVGDGTSCLLVDVGSGLGYVGQVLTTNWGHSVIGIEGNSSHTEKALTRGTKSQISVKTVNFHISSTTESQKSLEELLPNDTLFYLIGLHACGDLTSSMMSWFKSSTKVQGISIVSCCYHKMKLAESFPFSEGLRSVMDINNPLRSTYARRLASQDPFETWLMATDSEHKEHADSLGRRCLVQYLASTNGLVVERIRRKCGKVGNGNPLEKISENFRFRCKTSDKLIDQSSLEEKIQFLFSKQASNLALLELLTGLQSFLQLPLELLILCDKMLYLQELGYSPSLKRIFDPSISPRCFVISCKKY